MDDNGGSGTTWAVADGSTTLMSGTNDPGGSGNFEPAPISVAKGDTLYFILGPSADQDVSYDTTELNLTITEEGSARAVGRPGAERLGPPDRQPRRDGDRQVHRQAHR